MAGTTEAAAPLENFEQLVAHFQQGPKPKTEWKIGTEHEKFVFNRDGNTPVPYDGPNGIRALLEGLQRFGWSGIYEGEYIIGLKQDDGATISLEPGGQFELSGAQVEHIHQTCTEVGTHLRQVREVADELGLAFLGLGFQPKWSFDDVPIMPKGRYTIMRNYMPKVGGLGRQMMFRSCTVQTNLDFSTEADMVKKLRVSLALQPIATALFANSPFFEGRPNGFKSYRANVWGDTDSDRTGMLPFMFKEGAGFAEYANWALDVPMYFAKRNGVYVNLAGRSFRDFMAGKLPELPGDRPTAKDWEDHLSTLFPEVRLKTYLEMRGADAGPWSALCALPAFWVGLLYDETALDAAWDMVKDWSAEEREGLRRSVPAMALQAPFRRTNVQSLAREALAIARQGLKARARLNSSGDDETGFLSELDEIAATGVTPAERLLERYRTEWNRDVEQAFIACAY